LTHDCRTAICTTSGSRDTGRRRQPSILGGRASFAIVIVSGQRDSPLPPYRGQVGALECDHGHRAQRSSTLLEDHMGRARQRVPVAALAWGRGEALKTIGGRPVQLRDCAAIARERRKARSARAPTIGLARRRSRPPPPRIGKTPKVTVGCERAGCRYTPVARRAGIGCDDGGRAARRGSS